MITVLESAEEECDMPVTVVCAGRLSSAAEACSSDSTDIVGNVGGSVSFSEVEEEVIGTDAGNPAFVRAGRLNFHHNPASSATARATRTSKITILKVNFGF